MNYITITTPDNIEIEYRLAGAGSRIAAAFLDFLIQSIVMLLVILTAFFIILGGNLSNISSLDNIAWFSSIIMILIFFIFYGYFILTEILMNGQTIGKKLLGLRVIRENGAPISLVQSLIRNILKLSVDLTGIGVIMIMFSKKCKRIGDMASSTIVIAEDPRRVILHLSDPSNINAHSYTPYNNHLIITDKEYRLLKDYFVRKDDLVDGGETVLKTFISYFAKKFSIPEDMFSEDVLMRILEMNSDRQ